MNDNIKNNLKNDLKDLLNIDDARANIKIDNLFKDIIENPIANYYINKEGKLLKYKL